MDAEVEKKMNEGRAPPFPSYPGLFAALDEAVKAGASKGKDGQIGGEGGKEFVTPPPTGKDRYLRRIHPDTTNAAVAEV